jgi:hypothetical protein
MWKNTWIAKLIAKFKADRKYKKKLAAIRKRDPHIYK